MTNGSITKISGVLNIVLLVITIILFLLIYPIKEQISAYCNRVEYLERVELVRVRQEQASIQRELAELRARTDNMEKLLEKIDQNVERIRKRFEGDS